MIVNTNNGVFLTLRKAAHHIQYTFLHFRIGALYRIELNTGGIGTRINATNGATTHTDAVIIATHYYNALTGLRFALNGITLLRVTYTTGKHNHLVVSITIG